MVFIILYYAATNIASDFVRTTGGLVLMAALVIAAVLVMGTIRRGGDPTEAETALGDD